MTKLSALEKREPDEAANIAEMTDILRRKMERDYEKGDTRRVLTQLGCGNGS